MVVGNADSSDSRVQAVVDVTGPTDIEHLNGNWSEGCPQGDFESPTTFYSRFFTTGASYNTVLPLVRLSNPIAYVDPTDPPFFIAHGTYDCLVPYPQSEMLYNALVAQGVEATLYSAIGYGHGLNPNTKPDLLYSIRGFLDHHLKLDVNREGGNR